MFSIVPASVSLLLWMKKNPVGEPALQMAAAKCLTAWVLHRLQAMKKNKGGLKPWQGLPGFGTFFCRDIQDVCDGRLSIIFSVLFSRIFEVSLMEKTFSFLAF